MLLYTPRSTVNENYQNVTIKSEENLVILILGHIYLIKSSWVNIINNIQQIISSLEKIKSGKLLKILLLTKI